MPAAVCKKAVSHAWLMQRGSEQSAVFHTYTEVPTRHTPTRSPCPPLPSCSQMPPPKRMPTWPQGGRTQEDQQLPPHGIPRSVCSPELDAGLAAVPPECCLETFIHRTPSPLSPAATTPARPGAAPAAAALLSSPAVPQHSRALTGSQALTGGCWLGLGWL